MKLDLVACLQDNYAVHNDVAIAGFYEQFQVYLKNLIAKASFRMQPVDIDVGIWYQNGIENRTCGLIDDMHKKMERGEEVRKLTLSVFLYKVYVDEWCSLYFYCFVVFN